MNLKDIDEKGFAVGYKYEAITELKGEWTSEETIDFVSESFSIDSTVEVACSNGFSLQAALFYV